MLYNTSLLLILFFINLFYLFYFWLRWVFIAARGLSLVAASGRYSSLQCAGFSLWWLLLLQSIGSRCTGFSSCGLQVLECRLSSCGARAQLLCSMWDLPGPGLEPVSPALAGGCLTTVPPGRPCCLFYTQYFVSLNSILLSCPLPLPPDNHQFVLFICESVSVLLYTFILLFFLIPYISSKVFVFL